MAKKLEFEAPDFRYKLNRDYCCDIVELELISNENIFKYLIKDFLSETLVM